MLSIMLATRDSKNLASFAAGLEQNDQIEMVHVDSAAKALEMVRNQDIDLVVVGEELADMRPVEFVSQLVTIRPMINTAIVSSLSPHDFHEATEGLGVLMQLPPSPSTEDAATLLGKVDELSALLGRPKTAGAKQ